MDGRKCKVISEEEVYLELRDPQDADRQSPFQETEIILRPSR